MGPVFKQFLAIKMRRDPDLREYKLVFLTDRTQLDEQLIGILFAFGFGTLPLVCAILIGGGAFFVLQDQASMVEKPRDKHRPRTIIKRETHASVEFDTNGVGKYKNWEIRKNGDKYHVKQATLGNV